MYAGVAAPAPAAHPAPATLPARAQRGGLVLASRAVGHTVTHLQQLELELELEIELEPDNTSLRVCVVPLWPDQQLV